MTDAAPRKRKIQCSARLHDWDREPAGPGARCRRCGKEYGKNPEGWKPWSKARPKAPATTPTTGPTGPRSEPGPAQARVDGPDLSRLAAKWAPAAAVPPVPAAPPADAAAPEPPEKTDNKATERLADFAARPLADGLIVGCAKVQQWAGRQPGEPDPEWLDRFRAGLRDLLRQWLPKAEVTPASKTALAFVVLNADMYLGGKPIDRPQPRQLEEAAPPPAPTRRDEADRPPLRLVKPATPKESEWQNTQSAAAPAASPAGAPSSGESALSSSTSDYVPTQTEDLYGLESTGGAPGAAPDA